MDMEHHLDNHSSINLRIEVNGKKGWVRLSSVYGSFNFASQERIPDGALAKFSCPHCGNHLQSQVSCSQCDSPMVPLDLAEGGKVYICSKKGCRRHFLEFEDAEDALNKFYRQYSMETPASPLQAGKPARELPPHDERELILNNTFLNSYCPHCRKSLISRSTINIVVENREGRSGELQLSPFLNVFTHKSTIEIPEGEEVRDMKCPGCRKSLVESSRKCATCGSHTAQITVSAMRKLIPFFICLKKGCTWHGLSPEDTNLIALEDSLEW